ncbi:hypothetical protein L6164_022052 [Bauhinia variegata]|uniref:Uncharacterized protein n=1 Tax=Bauhinia variegata TaxID=167791 RepID=A0ACB9MDU2_BAUVA|nr:hypothetical protein L6164_022052 [Bauhinia variegata]
MVDFIMAPTNSTSYYAIDLIYGANVPVNVVPIDCRCSEIQCYSDLKLYCPDWLTEFDDIGKRIACRSLCLTTHRAEDCCTGKYAG